MALMKQYRSVIFICGYKPCRHEGEVNYEHNDPRQFNDTIFCPECNVFNYKPKPPEIDQETLDKFKTLMGTCECKDLGIRNHCLPPCAKMRSKLTNES